MIKKNLTILMIIIISLLFITAGIYAKAAPDIINLSEPAYKKHKKGIVKFTHQKHQNEYAKEYPELYKNNCGECHHDKGGKPLTKLKGGDDVQKCIECHKIPGERPKGKKAPKLNKKERLEYHAEAFHYNCKGCHKSFNKQYKPKKAPTTCSKCHPKKKG